MRLPMTVNSWLHGMFRHSYSALLLVREDRSSRSSQPPLVHAVNVISGIALALQSGQRLGCLQRLADNQRQLWDTIKIILAYGLWS